MADQNEARSGVSAQFLWRILTFMMGALLALGVAWGTRSNQLDDVVARMTQMSVDLRVFMDKYNGQHEDTAVKLNDLNKHLEYDDKRLDDLERRVQGK
jgi:archaellum component FlaC